MQTSHWLISAKKSLKKVSAWFKKNWQLIAGFCLAVVLFILAKGKFNITEYLDKIREGYDKEIDSINKSHDRELQKREDALSKRDDVISDAENNFDKKVIDLESKKREIAEDALKGDDANRDITNRLSDITGIDIHD